MEIRLKDKYKNEVFKAMQDKFGYSNPMEVPKLTKITINMGLSEAKDNAKVLPAAVRFVTSTYQSDIEEEAAAEQPQSSEGADETPMNEVKPENDDSRFMPK